MPPLPTSQEIISIPDEFSLTQRGTPIIAFNDMMPCGNRMLILASSEQIKALSEVDMVFADGTFKTCPSLFKQVYIIRGQLHNGQRLVLVFALLPNKLQSTYSFLLRKLRTLVMAQTGISWSPRVIMTDFESGIMPAVRAEIPTAIHKGCYFHYTKAMFRKIQMSPDLFR